MAPGDLLRARILRSRARQCRVSSGLTLLGPADLFVGDWDRGMRLHELPAVTANENSSPAGLDSFAIRKADGQPSGGPADVAFPVALGLVWCVGQISSGAGNLAAERLGGQLAALEPLIGIGPNDSHHRVCRYIAVDDRRVTTRYRCEPLPD